MPENQSVWWIKPKDLDDLTVEEVEGGFDLSAPDGTECAAWLSYYNQTEELRQTFNDAFVEMLREHLENLEEKHGCTD